MEESMKPDYKNWVPKEVLILFTACTCVSFILLAVFGIAGVGVSGTFRAVLSVLFALFFNKLGRAVLTVRYVSMNM